MSASVSQPTDRFNFARTIHAWGEPIAVAALLTTLFLGAVVGSIYSLSAVGLVLTYRASGVFNFAHGAIGMLFAFAFFQLTQGGRVVLVVGTYDQAWSLPTGLALVLVVGVLAPSFGWALDRMLFRRLRAAGEVVQIVATIGLLVALWGLAGVMWGASTTLTPTSIFSTHVFSAGEFRATVEQVATVALSFVLAAGLIAFLRYAPLGVRMRAVVDRPEIAELSGVDAARVSATSWAIGTGFSALAGILIVPFFGSLDPTTLAFFVVIATAAAVVGRLESFWWTLWGGFGIAIAQLLVQRYASSEIARQLRPAIPFLVLFAVLFRPRCKRGPQDRRLTPALDAPRRPLPPAWRGAVFGATAGFLVVVPFAAGHDWQVQFSRVPPVALLFLSLVVLSGYAGQVSLCHAALAGFGAFVAAHLASGFGLPFLLAVGLGALAVVPIGVLLALRAADLAPLFLAFATLAFGAMMDEVAFNSRWFSGGLGGVPLGRPPWLASALTYYLFGLAVFAVFALLVHNLRRSKTGLALSAMRDTEIGLGALGVDVARLKLTAFSISAVLAGLAGALFSAADTHASPFSYVKFNSLLFLALAVIGGIGRWSGALVGAVLLQLSPAVVGLPLVRDNPLTRLLVGDQFGALLPVFFGLGALALARNPHGVAEQIRGALSRLASTPVRGPRLPEVEPVGVEAPDERLVTFPDATLFHRSDCILAAGKQPIDVASADGLRPCPVCDP